MKNKKNIFLQLELSRKHCLFALAFAFLCFHPQSLGSETLTLTTYYPAPYGGYVALLTTGNDGTAAGVNTLLARDAGRVGIGTTNPTQLLDIAGNAKVETVILTPSASSPKSPVNGMVYMDSAEGDIYRYWNGDWGKLLIAKNMLIGERILVSDFTLTGSWKTIGDLKITEKTPQRGFYSVTWGGNVKIDANTGKKVAIMVKYGDAAVIIRYDFYDDDDAKDGNYTVHDIGGSTFLQLNKDINYKIRINGIKTGNAAANDSVAISGMWIRLELVFA